jgi:rfaE bifunctional protein kinase chain/domain
VLVVGDLMLDEYVWGDVRRISPEAPVPVVEVRGRTFTPGGAGNTAAGVAALGGASALAGTVGADEAGKRLLAALEEEGVDCGGVLVDEERPTTVKTRVIAHKQQVVRTDLEDPRGAGQDLLDRLLRRAVEAVDRADAVALSDYAKGCVSAELAQAVIAAARTRQRPVIVDPKGRDYARYRGATVLTPNVLDAEQATNGRLETYDDLVEAGRRLQELLAGSSLLITRGADGMSLFHGTAVVDIPADAQEVFDVTGAGDTVVAVLATALGSGFELEAAARLANAAAGVAVAKVGTARVTSDELAAKLSAAADERPQLRQ